jgi:hypothetical protein
MGVAVLVLFDAEGEPLVFEAHADVDVDVLIPGFVLVVLDVPAAEFAGARHEAALPVDQGEDTQAVGLPDPVVVGPEGGRRMYDPRAILGGDEVAGHHPEGVCTGRGLSDEFGAVGFEGEELGVADAPQPVATAAGEFRPGDGLVARPVAVEVAVARLFPEMAGQQGRGEHDRTGAMGVGIEGPDEAVFNVRTDGEAQVRGERPGGGRPCHEVYPGVAGGLEEEGRGLVGQGLEHGHTGGVLHRLVGPRLVELVGTQPGARRGRVGLDADALVEQALVVESFEAPPEALDVIVLEGHVGVLEVDPVAHASGDVVPPVLVAQDGFAAAPVVVLHRDADADVLLGDAEFLLDPELHGQPVRIPSALAADEEAPHRLIAADEVLQGPGDDMVDARQAVRAGRTLVEDEWLGPFPEADALLEGLFGIPGRQDLLLPGGQVEPPVFAVFRAHAC